MQQAHAQPTLIPDPAQLATFWRAVVRAGELHEVRLPKLRKGPSKLFGVASGYFDDEQAFVIAVRRLTGRDAEGVYLSLNPVRPALKARAANRLQDGKPITTTDADIVRRRHLLIDVDPELPAGISATEAERTLALDRRDAIAELLTEVGWPAPLGILSTGNGGGLLYRIDLPNDAEATALVAGVLAGIKQHYAGNGALIDTTVSNAARIAKVAGSVSAKGDDLPERPWRLATAELNPEAGIVAVAQLAAVAAWVPAPARAAQSFDSGPADIGERLHRAGIGFTEAEKGYATVYRLDRCLTSPDHTDGACILRFSSGALAYRCHHNRCVDKDWFAVREQLGFVPRAEQPELIFNRDDIEQATDTTESITDEQGLKRDQKIVLTYDDPPASCFLGPFGEWRDLMAPTTEAPDAFLLAGILITTGAVMGRRLLVDYPRPLFPNLYGVAVGITGRSRKDHALDIALDAAYPPPTDPAAIEGPPFAILRDVSSAEGLVSWLKDRPNTIIRSRELTHILDNARRKSTTTILDKFIELWDTPLWTENQNKLSPVRANKPFLSAMASTQPSRLEERMTDTEVYSGFANRWLYFFGRGKPAMPDPPRYDPQAAWSLYRQILANITTHPEGKVFTLTPAAKELWRDWYLITMNAMDDDETEAAIRIRHHPMARKLALIYAVADGQYEIELAHLQAAIDLLDWSWRHLKRAIKGWGSGDEVKLENRIIDVLKARAPMKKWVLQGQCKRSSWPQSLFKRVIESMLANGAVVRDREGNLWLRSQVREP